jgi:hypothetical protein
MNKTEAKIQQEIFMYVHNKYCLSNQKPRHVIFSVPNESINKKESMQKKAMGMISGVSDLIWIMPDVILFIEVKTEIGRQSENQIRFQSTIENMGYKYLLVRSLEQFKTKISCYPTLKH